MDRRGWDERYSAEELIWKAEPNGWLVRELADLAERDALPAGRALDLACGEGRNAVWLAAQGFDVLGVDFSAVGLAKGRRLAADRGVTIHLEEADVLEWLPEASAFALVIAMYLHLVADERRTVMTRAASALAPGGVLLVVGHDSKNLTEGIGGPQDPAVLFSPEDIVDDLADWSELEVERAEQVRRTVSSDEGDAVAIDALVRFRRRSET